MAEREKIPVETLDMDDPEDLRVLYNDFKAGLRDNLAGLDERSRKREGIMVDNLDSHQKQFTKDALDTIQGYFPSLNLKEMAVRGTDIDNTGSADYNIHPEVARVEVTTGEDFEPTMVHELTHIGYGIATSESEKPDDSIIEKIFHEALADLATFEVTDAEPDEYHDRDPFKPFELEKYEKISSHHVAGSPEETYRNMYEDGIYPDFTHTIGGTVGELMYEKGMNVSEVADNLPRYNEVCEESFEILIDDIVDGEDYMGIEAYREEVQALI